MFEFSFLHLYACFQTSHTSAATRVRTITTKMMQKLHGRFLCVSKFLQRRGFQIVKSPKKKNCVFFFLRINSESSGSLPCLLMRQINFLKWLRGSFNGVQKLVISHRDERNPKVAMGDPAHFSQCGPPKKRNFKLKESVKQSLLPQRIYHCMPKVCDPQNCSLETIAVFVAMFCKSRRHRQFASSTSHHVIHTF